MVQLNTDIVNTLKSAVGPEAFAAMAEQFAADLRNLEQNYVAARASQDETAARETAHALKGAASNIGLMELGALAADLEAGNTSQEGQLKALLDASLDALSKVE